ncbi:SRPBCC family protein [Actinoplanes sp. CA-030573]|uniref:SRPBCC family protein n=1 Tax=Actinoplanes sp. CA-030573 TaxID=3239898 RepID=UPI003D9343C2
MNRELRFERLVQASPARVFDLFTSPAGQREFYGSDAPGWVVDSRCEVRVGGAWEITFGPSRGELYRHLHVFEAIERPRRLLLATTEIRPDGSRFSFSTEFMFAPRGGATLMTIVQWGFPSDELRDEHGRGVPHAFDRLERALSP